MRLHEKLQAPGRMLRSISVTSRALGYPANCDARDCAWDYRSPIPLP